MSTKLQVLLSMICHVVTFVLLGLGSIYENGILTFLSLVSLMIGLFFGKEVLESLDIMEEIVESELELLDDMHLAEISHENRD